MNPLRICRSALTSIALLFLAPACDEEAATAPPAPAPRDGGETPAAGAEAAGSSIHFTDVTAESGLHFRYTSGAPTPSRILEVKGGGVALIDHDGDGDLDIFVPNGATPGDPERGPGARLFENLGGLRFRDVTSRSGLDLHRWSFGATAADYDGDGRDDLFVSCFGENALLKNTGESSFRDASAGSGIEGSAWSTSAAYGDFDLDGDLDLYVVNYLALDLASAPRRSVYMGTEVLAGPFGMPPTADRLYENRDGRFVDISVESGCHGATASYGLNLAVLDFDADGRDDIFVANDSTANFLFRNTSPRGGPIRFEEIGVPAGVAFNSDGAPQASMGIAIADVDGNGRPDILTTNFSSDSNTLHLNLTGQRFAERTRLWGLGMVSWPLLGWACGFHDFDVDGDEDLLVFNGHVYPEAAAGTLDAPLEQPPLLMRREERRFVRVAAAEAGPWLSHAYRGRSAAFGDLDGDGDVDVVFGELNGPLHVLRNDANPAPHRHWLIVELGDNREGSRNRRGLGSRIELAADGRTQTRWIFSGGPFQSTSSPRAHFGIPAPSRQRSLKVVWPDGHVQTLQDPALDQTLRVTRE